MYCVALFLEDNPRSGRLYISGRDENYKNDRLWWMDIELYELNRGKIDLKHLRDSEYREFIR